uniref:histidine kinase n=1 Tax=uncultured organism TaxID=155900 RepID=M1PVL0_9ZZZZ|nr:multi-sensor signal transduction histidine kinase [uncultured organism]
MSNSSYHKKEIRVLLVDDEEDFLEQEKIFLKREIGSIDISTSRDAKESLEMLKSSDYDCIVSDYQMPGMDGLELLEEIRNLGMDIPFIMFTGKGREEVAMECFNLGGDRYLQKGGDPKSQFEVLANSIEQEVKRKEMESQRDLQRTYFQQLFENSPMAIVLVDEDERIQFINNSFKDLFGHEIKEIKNEPLNDVVVPEEKKEEARRLSKKLKNEEKIEVETYRERKNGESIDVLLIGYPIHHEDELIGFYEIYQDITDRREIEKELIENKERLELALQSSDLGVWDRNIKTGDAYYDEKWANILGYSIDEIDQTYEQFKKLVHPEEWERVYELEEKHLKGELPYYEAEFRMKTKSGDWKWILSHGSIVEKNENGEPVRTIGIHKDITQRKEREEQLELYKMAIEESDDLIVAIDEDYNYLFANQAYKDYQSLQDEIKGKNLRETLNEEIFKEVKSQIERCLKGERIEYEMTREFPNLGEKVLKIKYYPLKNNKEIYGVVGVIKDITDRIKQKKELIEKEHRFRRFFQDLTEPAFLTEVDGDILEVNEKAIKELGYTKKELKNMNIPKDLAIDEKATKNHQNRIKRLKEGKTLKFKSKLKRKDGSILPVEAEVAPIHLENKTIVGSIERDIKELEKTKKKLKNQTRKMEELHDVTAKMETVETKEKACEIAVKAAQEILNFELCDIDLIKNNVLIPTAVADNTNAGEERPIEEESIGTKTYKDKKSFLIDDIRESEVASPVKDEYRSAISVPIGDNGIFQAISTKVGEYDQKDLEMAELLASHVNEALERINAREREDFLHSLLRHDVRNKAQLAKGYHQLIEDYDLPDEVKDLLKKAGRAMDNGIEIIDKISKLKKAEEEESKPVNINSVIREAIDQTKDIAIEQDMDIKVDYPGEIEVKGGSLLNQVFINIIENAIQHSKATKIRINVETLEDEVECIIEDNGQGIPDEDKEKVFNRGYTTDTDRGTGLGLFLVKSLLKTYDGKIKVKDSNFGGARFNIYLKKA